MPAEIPDVERWSGGLPARAFLIGYDVEKHKLTGGYQRELVQAAGLLQLALAGLLTDDKGKARSTPGRRTGDAVLDALLERIDESRPRPWKHWVTSDAKATHRAVRDRLVTDRVISVEERTLFGLIPRPIVTVRDTRIVRQLRSEARGAVLGGTPVDRVEPSLAGMVGMVAAVELNTVFSGRERRQHRERIKQLADQAGPAVKALRKAVEDQVAAAAAAAGG